MNWSQLHENSVLLTPNRRLQEYWLNRYNQEKLQSGHTVWAEPPIFSLNVWIASLWERYTHSHHIATQLLTDAQQTLVFEQLIQQQATPLLNVTATAKQVIAAWNILVSWDLDPFVETEFASTQDTAWFRDIAELWLNYCEQHQVLDQAQSMNYLIDAIVAEQLPVPSQLFYGGFSEWTPQQKRFLSALQQRGCELIPLSTPQQTATAHRIALPDFENEITTAARWAKQAWQQGKTGIACVIPELAHCRTQVTRIFQEQFSDVAEFPVNISGGTPLAHFPIIHVALLCLQLALPKIELTQVSSWLRSPFIGGAECEASIRAQIDWSLQDLGEQQISKAWVLRQCDATIAPQLTEILSKITLPSGQHLPSRWAQYFSELLVAAGWPGERELDSLEYQCVQRWLRLLDEFAGLSYYTQKIDVFAAVSLCQKLAASTMFQAQTPVEPIQVMGLLEAIGHPFSMLWLMGLHDEAWPASAKPNPFIPFSLQREHQLPHSSAERELQYYQQLTQQLLNSCEQVYFSFPLKTEDRSNSCSRILLDIPEISVEQLGLTPIISRAEALKQAGKIISLRDDMAPQVEQHEEIRGGSSIIQSMATCPFQAFARHRLGARQPQPSTIGLSASERGSLLHRVLEFFFAQHPSQAALLQLNDEQLTAELTAAITRAFKPLRNKLNLPKAFFECEQTRLLGILQRYIALEKQRPPFAVVGIETPITTEIAGLKLRLRVDRIDKTANGETIIFDYKTGEAEIADWFSSRPTAPQLPLYAICSEEIHGLVLAKLKSNLMQLAGLSENELEITGVKRLADYSRNNDSEDWDTQIATWQTTLTQLAIQFQQGFAAVDPKIPQQHCQFCDLSSLCRVHSI